MPFRSLAGRPIRRPPTHLRRSLFLEPLRDHQSPRAPGGTIDTDRSTKLAFRNGSKRAQGWCADYWAPASSSALGARLPSLPELADSARRAALELRGRCSAWQVQDSNLRSLPTDLHPRGRVPMCCLLSRRWALTSDDRPRSSQCVLRCLARRVSNLVTIFRCRGHPRSRNKTVCRSAGCAGGGVCRGPGIIPWLGGRSEVSDDSVRGIYLKSAVSRAVRRAHRRWRAHS